MEPIRPLAAALASASVVFPAIILGFIALRVYFPALGSPPSGIFYATIVAWLVVLVARVALRRRLSPAEQITVQFWAFVPLLFLIIALVLSVPQLLLTAFGIQLGPGIERVVALACVVLSAVVIWALWLRFRPSL